MLFRSAWVASDPVEMGTRSRTVSGVVVKRSSSSGSGGSRLTRTPERLQAEVVTQRGTRVIGAEHRAFLQQRDHLVDERRQAAGGDVRDQDVAVGRVGLDELVDLP